MLGVVELHLKFTKVDEIIRPLDAWKVSIKELDDITAEQKESLKKVAAGSQTIATELGTQRGGGPAA